MNIDEESWKIKLEEVEDKVLKVQFNSKMEVKSLERKVNYYNEKLLLAKTEPEKENISDIIEKAEFEIKMLQKQTDRDVRRYFIETLEILEVLNSIGE